MRSLGDTKQCVHRDVQRGEVIGNDVFNDSFVDIEVFMDKEIPHGSDLTPRYLGPLAITDSGR